MADNAYLYVWGGVSGGGRGGGEMWDRTGCRGNVVLFKVVIIRGFQKTQTLVLTTQHALAEMDEMKSNGQCRSKGQWLWTNC